MADIDAFETACDAKHEPHPVFIGITEDTSIDCMQPVIKDIAMREEYKLSDKMLTFGTEIKTVVWSTNVLRQKIKEIVTAQKVLKTSSRLQEYQWMGRVYDLIKGFVVDWRQVLKHLKSNLTQAILIQEVPDEVALKVDMSGLFTDQQASKLTKKELNTQVYHDHTKAKTNLKVCIGEKM